MLPLIFSLDLLASYNYFTILFAFCPYFQSILYNFYTFKPNSSGLNLGHTLSVVVITEAANVFPIWIAYIARMTGIHATIISHTVLPVVLIPLTYLIYYEIGRKLFKEKKEQLPSYMIIVNMLHIFGNVSIL